jgi:transcriptional regulator of acetoin/glycerol metabolism
MQSSAARVGVWLRPPKAQDLTDVFGRANSRGASKESNKAKLQEQMRTHPEWNYDERADALGLSRSTVGDYLKEIRTEA